MEEEEPLLSNPNYRRWRLVLDLTKLATGSRADGPLNSDITSPHRRTPVTPAAIAKQNFLYGISSPPTAEDDYSQFLLRSRSDLTGTSSLVDASSEQTSLLRNASPLAEGINGGARQHRSESLVINVDDDEKTPARTKRRKLPRSSSAPAMVALSRIPGAEPMARPELSSASSIVRQAVIGVVIYLSIGVGIYIWKQKEFKGKKTFPVVDGLYFCIVTMCTIGYGDIVPDTTWTKVFICLFILVGFGFIDILLSGLVTYVLDKQETVLLLGATDHGSRYEMAKTYIIDVEKGRMRIRIKVALALVVVGACTGVGTLAVRSLERLSWLDSFYVTVTSVTTLGYGDYAFDTLEGRMFASIWLLVSTLAVARAFLYLTELRIDRRNRAIAKWVLQREMTVGDLVAADIDHNGSVSALCEGGTVESVTPLAATVEDAMLVYAAMSGSSPTDLTRLRPMPPCYPKLGTTDNLNVLGSIKLGKYANWFNDVYSDEISETCERMLSLLTRSFGIETREIVLPELEEMRVAHIVSIGSEALSHVYSSFNQGRRMEMSYDVRVNMALFESFSAANYVSAQSLRRRIMHYHMEAFKLVDIIVTPTTGMTAPKIPPSSLKIGETDLQTSGYLMRFVIAPNLIGLPAISVPVGYDKDGLPIGLQLIGQPWAEATLLRLASAIEELAPSQKRPAVFYDVLEGKSKF